MFLEDYSTAISWRIAAIFFSMASIFSACIVVWFLIFRENPNMPDETDSDEQLRFTTETEKEKHNLLSEIVGAFKNFPNIGLDYTYDEESQIKQNFFQRLCYVMFGSMNYKDSNPRDSNKPSQTTVNSQPKSGSQPKSIFSLLAKIKIFF